MKSFFKKTTIIAIKSQKNILYSYQLVLNGKKTCYNMVLENIHRIMENELIIK